MRTALIVCDVCGCEVDENEVHRSRSLWVSVSRLGGDSFEQARQHWHFCGTDCTRAWADFMDGDKEATAKRRAQVEGVRA